MDITTIKLIEDKINIPLDLIIYINGFVKYEKLTNENIKDAVNLWCDDKNECLWKYGHISYWNTIKITNMNKLFRNKYNFNDNISDWDVSNVTNMSCMFYGASHFNQPLNQWNVSNVIDMSNLFGGALQFNQPLNQWNVSNATDMYRMFYGASKFNHNNALWYS